MAMRDIKFRVALMGYKKLLKVTKIEDDKDLGRMISCENDEDEIQDYYHNDYELMQYTGLKDKNGIEIYESDIVSVCFNIEEHPQEKVIVEWDTDSYVVKHKISDEFKNIYSLRAIVYECEVIGNIYENKELLEK